MASVLGPHDLLDLCCDLLRVVVFPEPEHDPTGLLKPTVGIGVASAVALHLPIPVVRVRSWGGVVLLAAMPPAPVYENGHPGAREDEIRCPP